MNKPIADIHVSPLRSPTPAGEYIDASLGKWFRPALALAIEERGMKAVFSRGAIAYDFAQGTASILEPKIEKIDGIYQVTVSPASLPIEAIRAIRNIAPILDNDLPELNHPSVRRIARDKVATNDLLEGIDLAKSYAAIGSEGLEEALSSMGSEQVVLKPRSGKGGQNIHSGSKSEISAKRPAIEGGQEWLLEEKLDLSLPVPLKGADAIQTELISLVNKNALPKELRVYTFGRDGQDQLVTSSVLRAAMLGDKDFGDNLRLYLDESSIPEAVLKGTEAIVDEFEKKTGIREMHLGIDWAYAKRGAYDAAWIPMEVNGTEPVLVYENENKTVSKDQAAKMAEQIYRISQRRSVR